MTQRLAGQAAIVTGAGSGIGRATTKRLMADGADVLAVDLNGDGLAETARLAAAEPGRCVTLTRDITDDDAPATMVAACLEAFGAMRILVNNAGIGGAVAAHMTEDEDLDRFLDVNLRALFRIARESVTAIRAGGVGGSIVQLASVYGIMGVPGSSVYSATKAAVVGLTRNMAADYGPYGIRVNAIAPGMILTPINQERFETNEYFRDMLLNAAPLGRVGAPEDIANGIAFLCSDEAGYISGHTLAIDGAWSTTKYRPFETSLHE
jgi:NAD(P)-dependent dehydrogenase (short-subunit alcohol dehydrogenase family)